VTETAPISYLSDYLRVIKRRRIQILLFPLIGLFLVAILTMIQTPMYQGEALVLVQNPESPLLSNSTSAQSAIPDISTESTIVPSIPVAREAQRLTGIRVPVQTLLDHLGVNVVSDTNLLDISYRDAIPSHAARLANGFARGYIEVRKSQAVRQLRAAASAVQARIAELEGQLPGGGQPQGIAPGTILPLLRQRLADLELAASSVTGSQIIEPAQVPGHPASPARLKLALVAMLVGIVLGMAWAFLRDAVEDRLDEPAQIEQRVGLPVLASIPRFRRRTGADDDGLVTLRDSRSPAVDAYQMLAVAVEQLSAGQTGKTIMVASPVAGAGSTTVAANLAVALGQAGRQVVLVSADLRAPRVHVLFGTDNQAGLGDLLMNGAAATLQQTEVSGLKILDAGRADTNPAALLRNQTTSNLFRQLRAAVDFVIVDVPPVLYVPDATILAPIMDGALLVADARSRRGADLVQARDQLMRTGARVLGVVQNKVSSYRALGYKVSGAQAAFVQSG
jgi:capsular exopolysaccharide synthesis family protein